MNRKSWIVFILFLLWGGGSTYWYICRIKGFCARTAQAQAPVPAEEEKPVAPKDIITYKWGSPGPHWIDTLALKKYAGEWKKELTAGKKLLVTGPYTQSETTLNEHPGLVRAHKIIVLLARWMNVKPDSLFKAEETLVSMPSDSILKGFQNRFKIITDNAFVQENNGKVLIYFPFNSDKQITTPEILGYLDELANRLKARPDMKIRVTGHTDNIGPAEVNKKMGYFRAKRIKDLLVQKGVNPNQIEVDSKGEANPIADNSTAEGRRKNRRVEISFLNQ